MGKVSFSHFSKVKRVENRNMQRVLEFLLKRGSGTKSQYVLPPLPFRYFLANVLQFI